MNRLAKGKRNELAYKKLLEGRGFICYKPTWNKFSKMKDIWGLFDIIGTDGKTIIVAQVKSNRCPKSVIEQIRLFKVPGCVKKVVAIKIDRHGWKELHVGDKVTERMK